MSELEGVGSVRQLAALETRALSSLPGLTTPFPTLNNYFHRNAVHPGELIILGGRKGTRKSTVMLNWVAHLLENEIPVGILTLDESLAMYVVKLLSVVMRMSPDYIESNWKEHSATFNNRYHQLADGLIMSWGTRPSIPQLQTWLDLADVEAERPRIVFCDYTSLLVHYRTRETERIPRLFEELQVWTRENELVTVALHQAGRTDEGVSKKYHGDSPMTAEGLLYGGEQQADIVLATYRPALNPLGNMSRTIAEMVMGDSFDEESWEDARSRVRRYKDSTMLQLLKNRPSTKGECFEGIELHSPDGSQFICERGEMVDEQGNWEEVV